MSFFRINNGTCFTSVCSNFGAAVVLRFRNTLISAYGIANALAIWKISIFGITLTAVVSNLGTHYNTGVSTFGIANVLNFRTPEVSCSRIVNPIILVLSAVGN